MCCLSGEEELTHLNRLGDLNKLFPASWKAPASLLEALQEADIPNADKVAAACDVIAESVCGASDSTTVSKEDVAVISCYTFDFGPAAYELVTSRFLLVCSE